MHVEAVSISPVHAFSKQSVKEISLLAGLGVEGDAHCGATVKHRSRVARDPRQPNLRQVHLMHAELFDELATSGFRISPGELGENITTRGIDLLALPVNSELRIGESVVVRITGLRNPCSQIEKFQRGLLQSVLGRDPDGQLVRKAGVMGIVVHGGVVRVRDAIELRLPGIPHLKLQPV